MQDNKHPFQIEADKQFIRDFGTPYKDHPQGDLTIIGGVEAFSKYDGSYPSLGNPNPLPEIAKCCGTEPNIVKQTEVFVNELIPYVVISCPTCHRQGFKVYTKFGVKSHLPSEIQIRHWNRGKS